MVDEFVYQLQSFCQYQAKLKQRTDQELAFLRQFDKVWNVVGVLNYLQALIEKSMILQILDKEKNANFTFTATDGYDYYGGTNVLKVLGYFSIAGLLHVHCLLGDYQSGLCALSPIDINQPRVFNTLIGCQITTIYYYSDTLEYGHHLEAVQDAYRLQLNLFLSEVQRQQLLSSI